MTTTAAVGRLLSVNVGLPPDVAWEGRTVHTGIWKSPVDGPQLVRRLNIDGDGQGDLQGHGGVNRAVYVYQIESHQLLGEVSRPRRLQLRAVRRELHGRRPGRRRGLRRGPLPHRLGPVRGQPAAGHLLPARRPDERAADALPAGRAPPSRLLLPGHRGGQGRGGRLDRARRARPRGDDGRGDRRPAVPAAQGAPGPGTGAADPGPEPGLAGIVPRPARPGARRRGREAGLGRTAETAGDGARPRERERDLGAAGAGRRQARRARPARAVPDRAAAPGRRGGPAAAHLLAVRPAEHQELPDQRQTRAARRRQRLHQHETAGRGRDRGRRAARLVRAPAGRRPGGADQRRGRGDPGPGDAARAGGRAFGPPGVVPVQRPQRRPASVRAGGRAPSSSSCQTRTASSVTATPGPTIARRATSTSPDG